MTELADRIDALAATRADTLAALAGLADAALDRPVSWRGGALDLRFLLLQIGDLDDERRSVIGPALAAAGWEPSTAQRILADAVAMRGRMLGTLVGLDDADLDREPAAGEWPPRAVLGHVLSTERRYAIACAHAAARAERIAAGEEPGPVRPPDHLLPPVTAPLPGDLAEVRRALLAGSAEMVAMLAATPDAALTTATNWLGIDLDLRFRLLRLAAHERQHLIHMWKTLAALGVRRTEAAMIVAEAEAARGALLGLLVGVSDDRAAAPLAGGRSLLDQLAAAAEDERALVAAITAARD